MFRWQTQLQQAIPPCQLLRLALGGLTLRLGLYGALPLLRAPTPWLLLPIALLNVSIML